MYTFPFSATGKLIIIIYDRIIIMDPSVQLKLTVMEILIDLKTPIYQIYMTLLSIRILNFILII